MKVLVIRQRRPRALVVWRLHQSETGLEDFLRPTEIRDRSDRRSGAIAPTDIAALAEFAKSKSVDLTIVGPEDVLATESSIISPAPD